MSPRTGAQPRRLGSIRLSLILLALVPSVTLAAMWGVTTTQMFTEGLRLRSQTQLSRSTGAMGTEATLALQRERSLSAAWLAGDPRGSRAALETQRKETDRAVGKLVGQSDAIKMAPARISDRLYSVLGSVGSLEYYRGQVDDPTDITAAQALDQYSSIIDDQIHAFQELSQVDDGDLTSQAGPLVALEHAAELVAQEDAQLTLAWPAGRLTDKSWATFTQLVDTRRWLVQDQIVPSLQGSAKTQTERILQSAEWQSVQSIEDKVLAARPGADGKVALPAARDQWAAAFAKVGDEYGRMIRAQTSGLLDRSGDKAHSLLVTAASLSAGGLVALLLCVGMSWRITRSLSRRLRGLREATLSLAEERLPDVVARLDRGETVDADLATPPLDYGRDELGQVARAFNKAQRTAVHTAVELADIRRGFQKVILGIARQSQNLVNLQLTKLDTLEREHTDPDVLKGLYELDSTASQLRRYEENLVIISGEQPRRSWREPVALIDILRSAVGEVAQYQRVEVHTDEDVYLVPPAVADVIHLLAELIDNATAYSPAPSPVGVRAALVAKGLVVEVEDRGLGMAEEDYASFNAQLAVEPKFDVVALADDLRLGMFVIARLATRHGIAVTLRPSPYGGTTAIVLLPHDIVVREVPEPARSAGQAWDGVTGTDGPEWHESTVGTPTARTGDAAYTRGGTAPGPRPQPGALNGTEHARAEKTGPTEATGAYGIGGTADNGPYGTGGMADTDLHGTGPTATTGHYGTPGATDTGVHGTGPTSDPYGGAAGTGDNNTYGTGRAETAGAYGTPGATDTGLHGTGDAATAGAYGTEDVGDAGRGDEAVSAGWRAEGAIPTGGRPAEAVPGTGGVDGAVPGAGRPEGAARGAGRAEGTAPGAGRPEGTVPATGHAERAVPGAGRPEGAVPAPGRPGRARYPGEERWVSDARHAAAAARGGEAEREAGTGDRAGQPGRHARRPGLAPLPRRVPQTSLVAELLEDGPSGEQQGPFAEFTPEHAASSLGGFQRGTLRARDEGAATEYDQEEAAVTDDTDDTDASSPAPGTSAAGTPADR